MRLLIFTQKINKEDATLGFFVDWIKKISPNFEKINVICLERKNFDLPENVEINSLGKEEGLGKISYIIFFYKYLFDLRGKYDAVLVHMNQEYVLLGGLFWKFSKTPVYLWRNHPRGNFFTRLAVFFSTKVFCTAKDSFTSKFKKTIIMPVGVDTVLFREDKNISKNKNSVCMIGRISPIKRIDLALESILILINKGVQVSMTVLGPCDDKNLSYLESLKDFVVKNNLSPYVKFFEGVKKDELPKIYNSNEIFINLTETGSFDKTIVEACACGLFPITSNQSLESLLPEACITKPAPEEIARSIEFLLRPDTRVKIEKDLKKFVSDNSLDKLVEKLTKEIVR